MGLKITIAGAGIGGLAAGIALARDGHAVRVAERAPEISEVGAGIQVSANGRRVIEALGLGAQFDAVSKRSRAVRLIDGPSARLVTRLDLENAGRGLIWANVHRARLIEVLASAALAAGVRIETGREIDPPGGGAALPGDDLLIGADGLHSRVRQILNPSVDPFFTHQVAWRALIPEDANAPVESEVHMGPGRHLVSYPLAGGLRNIVAVEERRNWADEGWSIADDPEHLRAAFARFSPRVRGWLDQVEQVYLWGLFRHPVARSWAQGRQVILGDAAHPTLPFLAQGANMALEDAWVLAACLKTHDLPEALLRYQAAREERARRVVDASTGNARNFHLSFPPMRFLAHTGMRIISGLAPERILGRYDWLYRHDVTTENY
ncbi:MAG: FAD-dependent monooxygenase [Silicimonas sp.]|nr:FAD-dependent monooxygenase [Silicimonas sp.]